MVLSGLIRSYVCIRCQLRLPAPQSQGLVRSTSNLRLRRFSSAAPEATSGPEASSAPEAPTQDGEQGKDSPVSDDEVGSLYFEDAAESPRQRPQDDPRPEPRYTGQLVIRREPSGPRPKLPKDVADLRREMFADFAAQGREPRRFFKLRGQELMMKETALPIGILGKNAEALILQDVGISSSRNRRKAKSVSKSTDEEGHREILSGESPQEKADEPQLEKADEPQPEKLDESQLEKADELQPEKADKSQLQKADESQSEKADESQQEKADESQQEDMEETRQDDDTPTQPEQEPEPPVGLEQILKTEAAKPSMEEAMVNINELRPQGSAVLTESEFMQLKHTLLQGFTSYQLHAYRYGALSAIEFQPPENPAWVLERSPWIPLKGDDSGPEDSSKYPLMVGYDAVAMQPKERIALKIMRECWGVSRLDINDRFGRLDVKLRELEFELLILGSKRWLANISRTFLKQNSGEQILVTRDNQNVTIFAPKTTAEAVLDEINAILSHTRTATFPVTFISHKPLQLSKLQEIGRVTNTLTRLSKNKHSIQVSWVSAPNPGEELEDLGEAVLRSLISLHGPAYNVKSDVLVEGSKEGLYIVDHQEREKMTWSDRLTRWGRWVTPSSKGETPSRMPQIHNDHWKHMYPICTQRRASPISNSAEPSQIWTPEPLTSTRAIFGHVVHAQPQGKYRPTIFNDSYERNFIPVIPPLSSLDLKQSLVLPDRKNAILLIRFLPSPLHQSEQLVRRAPPLELRIEFDEAVGRLRILSLRAITQSLTRDILMPAHAVDLRLEQKRYHEVAGSAIPGKDAPLSPILQFLKDSELAPWDRKLRTPAYMPGLSIPESLLAPKQRSAQNENTRESKQVGLHDQLFKVDYLFTALEVQRSVVGAWDGFSLVYTSIQTSEPAGRRAELSLEAVPAPTRANFRPGMDDETGRLRTAGVDALDSQENPNAAFLRAVNAILGDRRRFRWLGNNSV